MTEIPARLTTLPIDQAGRRILWHADPGVPGGVASGRLQLAVQERLCWYCGERLGLHLAFVGGAMTCLTGFGPNPAGHRDCAEWIAATASAEEAPSLLAQRPQAAEPAVFLVWLTKWARYNPVTSSGPRGEALTTAAAFILGEPLEVTWWAGGRTATRDEVIAAFEYGAPSIAQACAARGRAAMSEYQERWRVAMSFLPLIHLPARGLH